MSRNYFHGRQFLLCISLLIALIYPIAAVAQSCDPPVATAVSVQGTVEVQKAGASGWQAVKLNDTYCPGDTIRTGGNSRGALALASEAVMRLNENSTFTLQEFKEKRSSVLDMLKGAAHFFSRQPKSLEVRTPYTIAGVRGTEFFISVDDTQTFLSIFEGNVLAANEAGELNLTSGQSAVAEKGKAPVLRVVAKPRDAVQWALYYPPVIYDAPAGLIDQSPESITDPRLLSQQAALLLSVGRIEEASADLDRALRIDPNFSDALALQAIIAIVQNDKDKALDLARKAVDATPQSATAWIALSYAKQARFELEGARDNLYEAVRVEPNNALAWARLSEIEASFGRLGKALDAAKKAESLAPNLALTQTVLGFAYLTNVKIKESQAAFTKAIELDQASPLARLGLGLAIIRSGKLKEGGKEIEIAASLDPNNSLIRSYLGKTYYEEKRIPLDEKEYAIAKELDPNDPTPWFYDAIAKQTTNRPVEALEDYEKAMELNDNRAVFRSKLLLDADLAARSAAIARIYNNLGFGQRGLLEGYNSVNADPTDFSGHRFLSDTYAVLPRHEIARVSELLQSQLLQPTNITPIQPTLAESNLFLISSSGPANLSFNEFNPIFNRNRAAVQASGLAGENSTWAGEGIVSGIYNNLSVSAGYSHFETDGWRINNDQEDRIANIFAQYELNHKTSFQAEYRYRDNERGDTQLRFFEDDFSESLRQEDETNTVRLGFKHAFTPGSILLGNFSYVDVDRSESQQPAPIVDIDLKGDEKAYTGELQYLLRSQLFNLVAGGGYVDIDREDTITTVITPPPQVIIPPFPGIPPITIIIPPITDTTINDRGVKHANAYLYSYIKFPQKVTWTLGLSGDFFDTKDPIAPDTNQLNPKIGVTWNLFSNTTLRAAAFRVLKRTLATDQTLEPTQVAGFNQFFDYLNATDYWRFGGAIDQKFSTNLYGGIEYTYTDLNFPYPITQSGPYDEAKWEEQLARFYLYWTPYKWFSLTGEYLFEKSDREDFTLGASDVKTHYVPLGLNFFHPSGISFYAKGTYINQDGNFSRAETPNTFEPGSSNFWLVDAGISYRLPKRYGFITVGATNLFDEQFEYFETDPDNPRIQPSRSVFAKLTLAFP